MRFGNFDSAIWNPSGFFVVFAILVLTAVTTLSQSSPSELSRSFDRPATLSQFVGGIVTRSAELVYISEQDSEVIVFYRNAPVEEISDKALLSILRRPSGSPIIQQSWSAFFQIRTRIDPTRRWKILQDYLEARLTNLVVFRLPRDPPYAAQYDLYAIGIFNGNRIVGVQMFGLAT